MSQKEHEVRISDPQKHNNPHKYSLATVYLDNDWGGQGYSNFDEQVVFLGVDVLNDRPIEVVLGDVKVVDRLIAALLLAKKQIEAGELEREIEKMAATLTTSCDAAKVKAPNVPVPAPAPTKKVHHCAEKNKAGGCQLHNLQCGYPKCDQPPAQ